MTSPEERPYPIGVRYERVDAAGKVTGATRFLTDLVVPDMVYAAPVYSPIPFGRLRGIDDAAVRGHPRFLTLITAADIPGENQVGVILEDQPLLADEVVRYVGDTVALVVAETEEAAWKLAAKVRLDIEPWSPYLSIDASREARENFIHETNIACQHRVIRGDLEAGFAAAEVIVEAELSTDYQEHYYLEPQGFIVWPDGSGGIKLIGSLQCPFYVQKAVAKALGLNFNQVVVEQAPTGGAFGGKEDVPSEVGARTALAAWKLGRPVKMVYRRRVDVQLTSKRHPFQMRYKVGATREGIITAAEVLLEENAGAYATLSAVVSYRSAMQAMGPYRVPNIRVEGTSYYTNLPPTGAFRGFGSPQATFGHERVMDLLAERLGMDPVKLRLKNILRPGDETLTGQRLNDSVGAEETLRRAAAAAGWEHFKPQQNGRYREALGVASIHYGNCLGAAGWFMDGAGAKIQIHRDGSVSVAFGLVEMGQGALTVVTQMTAAALGIAPERIRVNPTTTLEVPDSGPAVASRNVVMTGNAIRDAARRLKPILLEGAAEYLKVEPETLVLEGDWIRDKNNGEKRLSFPELADYLYRTNRQLEVVGWWHVRPLEYDADKGVGEAYFTYSFATHIAHVRVDTLTGKVKVLKIWAAHDVGRAVNPAGLEGQVEGGTAQGCGWALTEQFKLEQGKVLTDNLATYLIPTAVDVADVETILVEAPEPEGPWGAKGIGEPSLIPTAAAVANAVSRAIGRPLNHLPLTPERVLGIKNG